MMTIIDKIKAKIRRRRPYKNLSGVSMDVENYIKTHKMNRKGADERLEAFYDKTVEKRKKQADRLAKKEAAKITKTSKPQQPRYVDITSTTLRDKEEHTFKVGRRQLERLEQLQAKANKMAREAGLPYSYDFHFRDKEGLKKYTDYLENITKDSSFFEDRATERLYTFIETTKRMFELYKSTTTDEKLKTLYDKALRVLNDRSTDYKALYERLKDRYDTSELSVYLFSSDVEQFEKQDDIIIIEMIKAIVGEE